MISPCLPRSRRLSCSGPLRALPRSGGVLLQSSVGGMGGWLLRSPPLLSVHSPDVASSPLSSSPTLDTRTHSHTLTYTQVCRVQLPQRQPDPVRRPAQAPAALRIHRLLRLGGIRCGPQPRHSRAAPRATAARCWGACREAGAVVLPACHSSGGGGPGGRLHSHAWPLPFQACRLCDRASKEVAPFPIAAQTPAPTPFAW